MRLILGMVVLGIILGCGILSAIFGLPERYIQREVTKTEMVGAWSITPKSETDVSQFVAQHPDWGIVAPWKILELHSDGSCTIEFEKAWSQDWKASQTELPNLPDSCVWDLANEENLSGKQSPVLQLSLEYPENHSKRYSLYIFEENGELILWDFIGDPDDFQTQDFTKTE